jgi:hypothetical protein
MWLVGQVMHTLPEHLDSPPVFAGVPVAQSCIFCVACILRIVLFPLSSTRPLPDLPICGNTTVSYKKRELPNLRENLGLPTLFYMSHMAHLFSFCVVVLFCCLHYVSLAQHCLWITDWLKFIFCYLAYTFLCCLPSLLNFQVTVLSSPLSKN